MPYNGSGVFNRILGPDTWKTDAAAGTKIRADLHDNSDNDIAGGLTFAICKDGQSQIGADIPWNAKKITNLGNAVNPQDAVNLQQVQAYNATAGANPSGITISGSTPNSVLKFTGTTGPWGLSFQGSSPNRFFGLNAASTSWIWNDNALGTGNNIMTLSVTTTPTLSVTSTDPDVGISPVLLLDRFSATPAANDSLGAVYFQGRDSTAATVVYAGIFATIIDPVNASEDGMMSFSISAAGTLATRLELDAAGMAVTGTLRFAATSATIQTGGTDRLTLNITTSKIFANTFGVQATSATTTGLLTLYDVAARPRFQMGGDFNTIYGYFSLLDLAGAEAQRLVVQASGLSLTLGASAGTVLTTGNAISNVTGNTTTDFPVGTTLLAINDASLVRTNATSVYLEGSGAGASYLGGNLPPGYTLGTALSGTWRSRGTMAVGTDFLVLMQRTA